MRHLRGALHLPAHPHHCQQLQQVLREGQDRGRDHGEEEEILVGRAEKRHRTAGGEKCGERRTAVCRRGLFQFSLVIFLITDNSVTLSTHPVRYSPEIVEY